MNDFSANVNKNINAFFGRITPKIVLTELHTNLYMVLNITFSLSIIVFIKK